VAGACALSASPMATPVESGALLRITAGRIYEVLMLIDFLTFFRKSRFADS